MATNQQRREAAKRKLERQLARRAERARRRRIVGVGVTAGAVIVVAGLVVVLTTRGGDTAAESTNGDKPSSSPAAHKVDIPTERVEPAQRSTPLPNPTTCQYPASGKAAKPVEPPKGDSVASKGTVNVTLHTTAGDIPLVLDRALAPCTVNSFLSLAKQGYYTDTSCHRLGTKGLQMLQCGDPTGKGNGGPGYTIPDEAFDSLKYGRGILAMARTQQPNSGGSQFFMVYGEAPLPPDYTVFGTITDKGLAVLDKVARGGDDGRYDPQPGGGKPNIDVTFTSVSIGTK